MEKIFYPFVFCFLAVSCAREEYIDIGGDTNSKLVVYSAIAPGDSIFVSVERTIPINEWVARTDAMVMNATVTMSDENGNSVTLTNVSANKPIYGSAQTALKILRGQTYYLTVATPNGQQASGNCTVPTHNAIWETLENKGIVDAEALGMDGFGFELIEGTWYELEERSYGYVVSVDLYKKGSPQTFNCNPNWSIKQLDDVYIFRDDFFNGYYDSLDFILCTTDPNLNRFNQMLVPYINSRDLQKNDFINSFKGVYPEFTNINGGLGFFGAYLTDRRKIYFQ